MANLFEFEPLGQIEVKGKAEPVETYRVTGRREGAVPTRGIEGLNSPLVGRDRELTTLLSLAEELRDGRGQVVSVIGEAGLGKSRLVAELRKALVAQGLLSQDGQGIIRWHEGRSLSYETTTPYAPFISLFNNMFALRNEEPDAEKYARIKTQIGELLPERAEEIAPFVGTVLGLSLPAEANERVRYLEPPFLRARVFREVIALIEAMAKEGPLVIVFEDLHWVDPTSLDLVEQLLSLTERTMLMLVTLFRPNKQDASWRFHELAGRDYGHRYNQIALEPLNETNSRTLVGNLLEIEDLPEKVRALILKKAEGNPFFVEEVIRSLLDAQLVIRENSHWRATREIENIAVPDTLAGVITARLDRLDEQSKRVAQTASVIGREFSFDPLAEVYVGGVGGVGGVVGARHASPLQAHAQAETQVQALDNCLGDLQRRELVREKSRVPQRAYLFKHGLTQETAYASILLSRRRELHARVAETLARLAPERVNEIARHFLEARDEARALPYLVASGEHAARAASRDEAITYFKRALDILQTVEDTALARRAYEGLGKALEFAGDIKGSFETYHDMMHYAKERGDGPIEVSALNKISYVHAFMMGQFPEAENHLVDAERLAREYDDDAGLAELYTLKCGMCTMVADFSNADKYLTEAAELGRKIDHKDTWAYGLAHKSNTQIYMAEFDAAWQTAQEGLRVANIAGNQERKADIMSWAVPYYHIRNGDFEAARSAAEEAYHISLRVGVPVPSIFSAYLLGTIAQYRGDYDQAILWHERALAQARPLAEIFPFMLVIPLGALGMSCFSVSDALLDRAKGYHTEALGLLETPYGAPAAGSGWADLGYCALALGEIEKARDYFQNGLKTPSVQMYLQKPRLLVGKALVALAQKQYDEAERATAEARQYAEERAMKHIYPLLAYAEGHGSAARGNLEEALTHYTQAESLAAEIGMRPMLLQARASAAQILSALGREAEAEEKRNQAHVTIEEIAGLIQDEELRSLFRESALRRLHTPEVLVT